MKLQEEYLKEFRHNKGFYFVENHRRYTQVIINVKFSYAYKLFNHAGRNAFIKAGHDYRKCVITDGACVEHGELIAIQINTEINNPLPQEVLGSYFTYSNGFYEQVGNIPVVCNKSELRQSLYQNGFVCDGIKYVRYKRSSGSSRVGKCLFVDERLADRMTRWDKCGLTINENDPIDLAAWEAYISLPMSSIIDTIEIQPQNILVVPDFDSVFEDDVVAVGTKENKLVASPKHVTVKNSIWDGESLIDCSILGQYENKGMVLLRNRFFKTCAFNTNIQDWFLDNNITNISQLNGFTLAKSIWQIKLITTCNSIKYVKFGTVEQWLQNIDTTYGIVKYEKPTPYFDGRMVQSHYQLFNTLQLTQGDVDNILQPSLDYISKVRNDPDVLRYHINYPYNTCSDWGGCDNISPLTSKNEIVFKLLGLNDRFAQTKMYYDFKKDLVKGYIRNLKQGHILLHGNYSTLLGNGLELLKQSIGTFDGKSEIGIGNIHSTKFEYGKTILASRSPHITMGNVMLVKNEKNTDIDRYFNLTPEIVYVNAIGENMQQRLNGCDYDSDSILLTDNQILIDAAKKNYQTFKVPTCFVESKKTARLYNYEHKADLDVRTSVNKIGEIVNLSQQLNSLLWNTVNNGVPISDCMELYYDICKLAVLSGIEIDKAKKEFIINSANEIMWLKDKYKIQDESKTIKPMFFKMITLENGYVLSDKVHYKYFKTAMDYLFKAINSYAFRQSRVQKNVFIPFMDIVDRPGNKPRGRSYSRRDDIITTIRAAKEDIRKLYLGYESKTMEEREIIWMHAADRKQECINQIENTVTDEDTMYLTLKELDNPDFKDVSQFMFEVLFGRPNQSFFKLISNSKDTLYKLEEADWGNIQLYDFTFTKFPV